MIRDGYTDKDISRQRKYQLRKRDKGFCIICGEASVTKLHCQLHSDAAKSFSRMNYRKSLIANDLESHPL